MQRLLLVIMVLACLLFLRANADSPTLAQAVIDSPELLGSIRGAVLETTGEPAVGVTVTAWKYDGFSWDSHKTTTTDATGVFLLERLVASLYRVGFSDPTGRYREQYYNGVQDLYRATEIVVTGNQITGINATVVRLARLAGKVAMADGSNPSNLELALYRRSSGAWSFYSSLSWYAPSEKEVPFLFRRLESGVYRLRASSSLQGERVTEYFDNAFTLEAATDITITAGSMITGVALLIGENPAGAAITGRVTAITGAALPNISVTAYQTSTTEWRNVRSTKTNAQGAYQFKLLEPSAYRLEFFDSTHLYATTYFSNAVTLADATSITLLPGAGRDLPAAQLQRTGAITGVITRFDGVAPTSATLALYRRVNGKATFYNYAYVDRGEDGVLDYKITGIDPGTYRLQASTSYQSLTLAEFYPEAATVEEAADLVVRPDQTTGAIDFQLGNAARMATLVGRVTKADGTPIPDIQVAATQIREFRTFTAKSDLTGSYQLTVTAPGTYTVYFRDPTESYISEYYDNARTREAATLLPLAAGTTQVDVNAILSSTGKISGTLVMYDDTVPSSPQVTLYQLVESGWQERSAYPTITYDEEKVGFLFKNLQPGLYRVGARPPTNAGDVSVTEYYSDTLDFAQATILTVTDGSTLTAINFVLGADLANARIEGTVLEETNALPGVKVELYRDLGYSYWPLLLYVFTDSAGGYRIDGLSPGRYRIGYRRPLTNGGYDTPIYWGGATELTEAAIITLDSTTITQATIVLSRPFNTFLPVAVR